MNGKKRWAPKNPGPIQGVLQESFAQTTAANIDRCEMAVDRLADWVADRCNAVVAKCQTETKEINKRNRIFDSGKKKRSTFCNLTVKSVFSGGDRRVKIQAYVRDARTYKRTGKMFEVPKTTPQNGNEEPKYNLRVINYQLRNTPELVKIFHETVNLAQVVASMSRRIKGVRRLINLVDRDRARLLHLPIPYLTDRPKKPEVATPEMPKPQVNRVTQWEDFYTDPHKQYVSKRRRDL